MADLVLVPGLNNTHAVFDGVLAALPSSVTPHAVDCPALTSVEAIATALLASLPQQFWLAGFSFGGYVALAMLEAAPERVLGMAMICSAPSADSPVQAQKRIASLDIVAHGGYFEMIEAQAANAFHPDSLHNETLMAARRSMVRAYGPERFTAHVRAVAARPDRTHLLDGRRPTAVIAAAQDQVFPPAVLQTYALLIPGASMDVVPDAGHLLPMERPRELVQILNGWMARRN